MEEKSLLPRWRDMIYIAAILVATGLNLGVTYEQVHDLDAEVVELSRRLRQLESQSDRIAAMNATLDAIEGRLERIEDILDSRRRAD